MRPSAWPTVATSSSRMTPDCARSTRKASVRDGPNVESAVRFSKSASTSRSRWASTPLARSEEHTSELQSQSNLVCRLLLEKKKKNITTRYNFEIENSEKLYLLQSEYNKKLNCIL